MKLAVESAMIRTGSWAIILTLIGLWVPMEPIAGLYLRQDAPIAFAAGIALILLGVWKNPPPLTTPQWITKRPFVVGIIALAGAVALVGTWLVFGNYGQARDEILADFAAQHFRAGVLLPPVPAAWHDYADALQPNFMIEVPGNRFWLSGYLPGNSLLRAAFGPATGPLLLMLGCAAVYHIARRLWPDERGPALVALLLSVTSAQLLTNAMTPYAMTAHWALNLVWLWLFLRGDRLGDSLAMAIGWLACGLHQLVFHPLFVLPFIAQLWFRGARRRAIVYAVVYAGIGIFWASYWQILLGQLGGPMPAASQGSGFGILFIAHRVVGLISTFNLLNIWTMMANLLRFLTWQNLALIPLMALSWPAIRAGDGIARPLAAGIVLLLVAMFVLMPSQGIGWGYRYLHGACGSAVLLAAYGWRATVQNSDRQSAKRLAAAAAMTVLVIPWQMAQAHRLSSPYRTAYQRLIKAPADVVLVDDGQLFLAGDLVRNRWDLSNRPLIMDLARIDQPALRALCAQHRVALFDARDGNRAGIFSGTGPWPEQSATNHKFLKAINCAGANGASAIPAG